MNRKLSRAAFLRLSATAVGTAGAASLVSVGADSMPARADGKSRRQTDDGYESWLRYRPVTDEARLLEYRRLAREVVVQEPAAPLESARAELVRGLAGLLDQDVPSSDELVRDGSVVVGTPSNPMLAPLFDSVPRLGPEGYFLRRTKLGGVDCIAVGGETARGALYGAFGLLRRAQLYESLAELDVVDRPATPIRMLNHWDNLDGSVERGYAGESLIWHEDTIQVGERQRDYARMLASVGVNGIAINNVNSDSRVLESGYLDQIADLAELFRAYGIQIYISANFFSPISVGGLDTADPILTRVRRWWKNKADEIYRKVPDFGGFLVKADSEGQPGPGEYGRTHAQGANALAAGLEPYGGIVVWRAFVYASATDRAREAYDEFHPLDGEFADNCVVQVKNGPIDFQVREPVSPLFGGMPDTNLMLELQVTQEYTGQQVHLCYLVPQWKEVLDFDTWADGEGSTVQRIVDGTLHGYTHAGIAGVSNGGGDRNWFGHLLAGANLHGVGRLCWNPALGAEELADEWARLSFGHDPDVVSSVTSMLLNSWPAYERYTSPLGVGLMCHFNHYDPAPEARTDYHRADELGVGFDRTATTGSGYVRQYHPPITEVYESLDDCPDEHLLFFHHVPYTHLLRTGKTVIQHIYDTHFDGVADVERMRQQWADLAGEVGEPRYTGVQERLDRQLSHAILWRDTINQYFYELSGIDDERGRFAARER